MAQPPPIPPDQQSDKAPGAAPDVAADPARDPVDPNLKSQGDAGNRSQNFTPHLRTQDR